MSTSNEEFKDTCSPLWIPTGVVVLLAMPALTAVVGWYHVLFVY
ncbi:hypothetical protein [Marinospirillum insulare]|nr:hypothetical protein [Marinospirillum insulare]